MNTTPLLDDLCEHIIPRYAAKWKVIGVLLNIPISTIDVIEHDYFDAVRSCKFMFEYWLINDTTASWEKIFTVIESCAVSFSASDKGD